MRAKPVERPPPKAVRMPKTTHCSLGVLYISESFSESSDLETLGRAGWMTSRTICFLWSRRLVMNLRVRRVTGEVESCEVMDSNDIL